MDLDHLLAAVDGKGSEEREVTFSLELGKLLFRDGQFKDKRHDTN